MDIRNYGISRNNNFGSIGGIKGQESMMAPSLPDMGGVMGDMTSISDEAMEDDSIGSNFNANGILPLTDAEQARLISEEITHSVPKTGKI